MNKQEMEEKLQRMVQSCANLDDAARDYESRGTRDSLETIEKEGRLAASLAHDLQDWHR